MGKTEKKNNFIKRLRIFPWTLGQMLSINSIGTSVGLATVIIGALLPVWLSSKIGQLVDQVSSLAGNGDGFSKSVRLFATICVLLVFSGVYSAVFKALQPVMGNRLRLGMRKKIIYALKDVPIRWFDKADFNERLLRANEAAEGLAQVYELLFGWSLQSFIMLAGFLVLASSISWVLLVICILSLVSSVIISSRSTSMESDYWRDNSQRMRQKDYFYQLSFDSKTIREVRALGIMAYFEKRWYEIAKYLQEAFCDMRFKSSKYFSLSHLCTQLFIVITLAASLILLAFSYISLGNMVSVWQISQQFNMTLQGITNTFGRSLYQLDMLHDLKEFLGFCLMQSKQSSLQDGETGGDKGQPVFQLKNVSFSYEQGKKVVRGINLTVPRGQVIAVCGENGAGKTTLAKILLGQYIPDEGEIFFNGIPYGKLGLSGISKYIGVAFQDFVCYPLTIRENIGFGDIKRLQDDEALLEASDRGGARSIVDNGAAGLDQYLGVTLVPEGMELSGGQWQRIAVSRAHMGDKDVLIMDEPTSKVDPLEELSQYNAIKGMLNGRTAVLISHRIGFARLADRILIVKDGTIVEDGTHEQLLKDNGEYARLFNMQAQWYVQAKAGDTFE